MADCMPAVNTDQFTTFESEMPPCLHITATRKILQEIDSINEITPESQFSGELCVYVCMYVLCGVYYKQFHHTPLTYRSLICFSAPSKRCKQ